jgi:hypothetical protein
MPKSTSKKSIKWYEYQKKEQTMKFYLCDACGENFSSASAISRHQHTVHTTQPCLNYNCWTCGLQFKRKDNYDRHNQTLKHQRSIEEYLLPSKEREEIMKNNYNPEKWYSNIDYIDNTTPAPTYREDTEKILRETPITIPLDALSELLDPRPQPANCYFTLNIQELDTMFPDFNKQLYPWDKTPLLSNNDDIRKPKRTETFMDLLMSDMPTEEILQYMDESDLNIPLSEWTKQTEAATTEVNSEVEETAAVKAFDDIITFSIYDMDTEETWITIDEVGNTTDETTLLPPRNFLDE